MVHIFRTIIAATVDNVFPHSSQSKLVVWGEKEWMLECESKYSFFMKPLPHTSQTNAGCVNRFEAN